MTYDLSYTVLNVVPSNVVGGNSGTDDDHLLPSILLRVRELGRMKNFSLEAFLDSRGSCEP